MIGDTLSDRACSVLLAADPADKIALTQALAADWRAGKIADIGTAAPPSRPARPEHPELKLPRDMKRRRSGGSDANRIALLHAVAHIELNAIDLACDLVARFTAEDLPRDFYDDWITVAADEARHHALLAERLVGLGAAYGDLPAHDGLWEAAQATSGDLLARLAVVPLVLEARGLDVTPDMIDRLDRLGDPVSAAVLRIIYRDEIGHVAAGQRWFAWACARRGLDATTEFHKLVPLYYKAGLKPPFNRAARDAAGFNAAYYEKLARVS